MMASLAYKLEERFTYSDYVLIVSPIDVVFSEEDVVQPDIVVVCDSKIVKERGVFGAPTVVIEVLSSSTAEKDKQGKYSEADIFSEKQRMDLKSLEIALNLKQVFEIEM
jgi:Uma2 family endonuclease